MSTLLAVVARGNDEVAHFVQSTIAWGRRVRA